MGETGKHRVRLKPCNGEHSVTKKRLESPAGALRANPMEVEPWSLRMDCNGDTPSAWHEVTVSALALEGYDADKRAEALLRTPFAVVYNHTVRKKTTATSSYLVSSGTGMVRILVERPAGAALATPSGLAIADPAGSSSGPVMTWHAVGGATQYLVNWRYGVRYGSRANADRKRVTGTSATIPFGGSRSGPITARVRAYSSKRGERLVGRAHLGQPPADAERAGHGGERGRRLGRLPGEAGPGGVGHGDGRTTRRRTARRWRRRTTRRRAAR